MKRATAFAALLAMAVSLQGDIIVVRRAPAAAASSPPSVATVAGNNQNANATTHTVTLPSGVTDGDLLLVFMSFDGTFATPPTWPGGWTQIISEDHTAGDPRYVQIYCRVASGEAATFDVSTGAASERSAHTAYRITGFHSGGCASVEALHATGTDTSPDPPELTPSWGSANNLWFAFAGHNDGSVTVSGYPSTYTNGRNDRADSTAGIGIGTAYKTGTATSDNPGTFTISSSMYWVAITAAVRPQ